MSSPNKLVERPPRLAWSISSASDPDAIDAYRDSLADLYAVTDLGGGPAGFFNKASSYQFGSTVFGIGASVGQTMRRSAHELRRSGFDGVSIFLNGGAVVGDVDGRDLRAGRGAIHFRDLSRPSNSRAEHVDAIMTVIPREVAPDWLLAGAMHGHAIEATTPAGRMLAAHLRAIAEVADELDTADGLAAIDAALVLARRSIGAAQAMSPDEAQAAYRTVRRMAIEVIDQRLLDRDLNADLIAAHLGVSRATLYRAFESSGGVAVGIQRRRLARAYAILRQRKGTSPTVADVGFDCGFASESHFSRAFRERYGIAPGELGTPEGQALKVRHDVVMDWLRAQ
ncbi:AraC family transcriptional regulator [Caulobacter sp. 17J80-11]|uniref:helix-turn-helix transcriptional regulator n=1 Tax=Caulobacter sp. 17J80-11 TaxID=2763502 RepID=UPI00165381DB|nr:AraC family transcriptional regulator [Caulobacter sp. 17J80-11]MBC6982151.1 AraC family transcriptional regulator [Caulobacter sp. 17J80-11]